ncbi:hypothetical protein L208DRAFT_1233446 [Tricholoma matsutake]|nr:hypothetical protein L208DRAFT_1233446 [Tricholoma matsutake 945]
MGLRSPNSFRSISTQRNIFAKHYKNKASKAQSVGNTVLGMESIIGTLPPWEAKKLYMAQIDPHLIHGYEVILDVDLPLLEKLSDVQTSYLRRVLGLHRRSMITPLFTETSLVPLRFRRIILTLGYLHYLTSLPTEHYAKKAYMDSVRLAKENKASWTMDLQYIFLNLPFHVPLPDLESITPLQVDEVTKLFKVKMEAYIQSELEASPKLYLLQNRLEPDKDCPPSHKTLHFRHYLSVPNSVHRKALTGLLLSSHALAIEHLRWPEHRRPRVQQQWRLCRLCKNSVESPEHALLECTGSYELNNLRKKFSDRMYTEIPHLPQRPMVSSIDLFKMILKERTTIRLLAKFTYEVLELFEAVPVYVSENAVFE